MIATRSKSRSFLAVLGVGVVAGALLTGCQKDSTITPAEEARFKNPSKEMPPEAIKIMKEHGAQQPPPQAAGPPK